MLDILFGVITFFVTQIVKWIIGKFGEEAGKNVVLALAFIVSLTFAYIQTQGVISAELIIKLTTIYGVAIGFYEVIYKRILLPIFERKTE